MKIQLSTLLYVDTEAFNIPRAEPVFVKLNKPDQNPWAEMCSAYYIDNSKTTWIFTGKEDE